MSTRSLHHGLLTKRLTFFSHRFINEKVFIKHLLVYIISLNNRIYVSNDKNKDINR